MIAEDIAVLNPQHAFSFVETDLAVSQTNTDIHRVATSAAAKADVLQVRARADGYITGLAVQLAAAKTAGTLTFSVTVNGTEVDLSVTVADDATGGVANVNAGEIHFSAGDLIGVSYTSDGSMLPAGSNDAMADVYLVYERVTF